MAGNILTPKFRGAWVALFRATAMKGTDNKPKFSIKAVFMPGTDLSELKKAAAEAASEKWGANIPKNLASPFRKNEDLENPTDGVPDDAIVMTFSANEDRRPGVVNGRNEDIIDEAEVYSGAYYRAQVRAYAWEYAGKKGVSFGLQNVQKMADGDPLGGRVPASKAFDKIETQDATSGAELFD